MDGPWIIAAPLRAITESALIVQGDPGDRMQLSAFTRELERAAVALPDKAALWRMGETLDLAHLGIVGGAMIAAPVLGAALRCLGDFFDTVQSTTSARLVVEGDVAQFHYRILDETIWPRRADAELTLGLLAGLVGRYAPQTGRSLTAQFEKDSAPSDHAIAAHLQRPVRVGEGNMLSFPARLLDAPRRDDAPADPGAAVFRDHVQALGRHVRSLRLSQPASDRVLDLLLTRMGVGEADQDSIARDLGMSQRTLRRRLDAEGVTFQHLAEIARRNIGHALLVRTDLPMIEIAMRLGYSDHTAFSRAFSRWFGASPRALRKAAAGADVGSGSSVTT